MIYNKVCLDMDGYVVEKIFLAALYLLQPTGLVGRPTLYTCNLINLNYYSMTIQCMHCINELSWGCVLYLYIIM